MARPKSISLRRRFATLLSHKRLWDLARATGFVLRRRTFHVPTFVYACALLPNSTKRSLADLYRAYGGQVSTPLAYSSFRERLKGSTKFLQAVLDHLTDQLPAGYRRLQGALRAFDAVFVADATVLALHPALADLHPGTRTNSSPAALKLHALVDALDGAVCDVQIVPERQVDHRTVSVGPWVRGRLLLFDLGYYRHGLFAQVERHGGFFVSRLKGNANPTILQVYGERRGRQIQLEGVKIHDALKWIRRRVLDCDVQTTYTTNRSTRRKIELRVVAVWHAEERCYRVFVTNVDREALSADEVAVAYRARWVVELVFKNLRQKFGLGSLPSRDPEVVEALMLLSLIGYALSQTVKAEVRSALGESGYEVKESRWESVFASHRSLVVQAALRQGEAGRVASRKAIAELLREARDPNRRRPGLIEEVEFGESYPLRKPPNNKASGGLAAA